MSDLWIDATKRYVAAQKHLKISVEQVDAIASIAKEMLRFFRSPEFVSSMLLLELSRSVIGFGKGTGKMGDSVLFCWSGRGPSQIIIEGLGAALLGADPVPATFVECAIAALANGITAEDFPRWFKAKFDEVAAKISMPAAT